MRRALPGALLCWGLLALLPAGLLGCGVTSPASFLSNELPSGDWLGRFNAFRSWAGLPPVALDASLTPGGDKHCKWMIANNTIMHGEIPGTECYSAAGDAAGRVSNLSVQAPTPASVLAPMAGWMTAPFHGVAMIDPRLTHTSFSHYVDNNVLPGNFTYGAALDVASRRGGSVPLGPVMWPGHGALVDLLAYGGSEYPDPVGPYGIAPPTGLPVYLQLPPGEPYPPALGPTSFSTGGVPLGHLAYDGGTYVNPGPPAPGSPGSPQDLGRAVLSARRCIVLMPHQPLLAGATYDVAITANGVVHAWSFSTSAAAVLGKPAPVVR